MEKGSREEWKDKKSLQIFLTKIRRQDREFILNENLQRESLGRKPLGLWE